MTILVPVDFSTRSRNALRYASAMAQQYDGDLRLLHVVPQSNPEPKTDLARRSLHAFQEEVLNEYNVNSTAEVVVGHVPDHIVFLARRIRPALVVMASRGGTSVSSALLASNTATVMAKSPVPVLAVPETSSYVVPATMVFGTENDAVDIPRLRALTELASHHNARIEVVHVVNRFADEEDDSGLQQVAHFRQTIRESLLYPNIHCEEYQHVDVAEGILCFVEEVAGNLLALSATNRTLVERLVRGNLNNEYAYQLDVPLLCLHGGSSLAWPLPKARRPQISCSDSTKV